MSEVEIGQAVFLTIVAFLGVGAVEVLIAVNKESLRRWWAWRQRRPNPHRYNDSDDFRSDLSLWKVDR